MAYNFSGANNDRIEVSTSPAATLPITLSCWARRVSSTVAGYTVWSMSNFNGAARCFALEFRPSTTNSPVAGRFAISNGVTRVTTGTTAADTWYHLAFVLTSSTDATIYLDGTTSANTAGPVDTGWGANNITIGIQRQSGGYTQTHNGDVAECAIWTAALTAAEIESLAKGFSPAKVRPQSLDTYVPLIRNINDISGARAFTNFNSQATVSIHPRVY